MTAQLALASNALIDEINTLFRGRVVTDIATRRIRREAERLKAADARGAYMVLGMLDCLAWSENGMRENHERVLRLASSDFYVYLNYVTSLDRMNFVSEAYTRQQAVYNRWPNEPDVVDACIWTALRAGRISAAHGFLAQWRKLYPDKPQVHEGFISAAKEILNAHGIDDNQGERMQEAVSSVLRATRVFVVERNYYAVSEDGGVVNYELVLDLPLDSVINLNMKVADHVVETFGSEWPSAVVYSFVPTEDGEQQYERDAQGVSHLG